MRTAFCGFSLASSVRICAILDLIIAAFALISIIAGYIGHSTIFAASALNFILLSLGGICGLVGVSYIQPKLLKVYSGILITRVCIMFGWTVYILTILRELVTSAVEGLIEKINEDAKERGINPPDLDRDQMINTGIYFITSVLVIKFLLSAVFSFYCARVSFCLSQVMDAPSRSVPTTPLLMSSAV